MLSRSSLLRRQNNGIVQFQLRLRVTIQWIEVHDQAVFDSEHRIVVQVLALAVEDLGCYWLVAVFLSLDAV